MCECRDCDNFKAKKREPQLGDRVYSEKYKFSGIFAGKPSYNPDTGDKVSDWALVIRDDGNGREHDTPWSTGYRYLTVVD